ncbi:MAG: DUF86 domain-containing protein [Gammaproteobacteria bacterium]|nr:DUF86 domain-containing protein [Gammaproteobacteria bacterium]
MDRDVIEGKLEALRYCVQRLKDKCPEAGERLASDPDLQDIIAMNLARAVQLSVDIAAHILAGGGAQVPNTMAEAFEVMRLENLLDDDLATRMKNAVGFRNIAVHAYEKINWDIVRDICRNRLVDFEEFASAVVRGMQ